MHRERILLAGIVMWLGATAVGMAAGTVPVAGNSTGWWPVLWIAAGMLISFVLVGIARLITRRKDEAPEPISPSIEPAKTEEMPEVSVVPEQKPDSTIVSQGTVDALSAGMEIHELDHDQQAEILNLARSADLDEIDSDLLREKLIRCVTGLGITKLLPKEADVLWDCVLSWDPAGDQLEKQATDLLSWACAEPRAFDTATQVVEHSKHSIPVPPMLTLNSKTTLVFERSPSTLLDEGSSAAVFRAQVEGSRDVAVKISRLSDYRILRITLLEFLLLRRAQGIDAVIRLFGAGCYRVKEEVFFFIVEEIAETTLSEKYDQRKAAKDPFLEKEVRDAIIKPCLESLAKLHERGIIHRDLKPKNIYLVAGVWKIGDFEIAIHSRDEHRHVSSGTFAGSPAYSTAAALLGQYGPQTDINSLACIGYVMLHGNLPAIDDAPGTSTLVRGIQEGASMTEGDRMDHDRAKEKVKEWLALKRKFVIQIRKSLKSTPFERSFLAPILSQGLHADIKRESVITAEDALNILSMIDLSEQAMEARTQAKHSAHEGEFETARKILDDFNSRVHLLPDRDLEIGLHVLLGDTLREIGRLESSARN